MSSRKSPLPLLVLLALAALLTSHSSAQDDTDWTEFDTSIEREVPDDSYETPAVRSQTESRAPFRRRIMRDDITIRIKNLRLDSGGKVRLVYGMPKNAKNVPAVFVLDVESNTMANASGLRLPGSSDRQKREFRQASYLLKSPFGSNMLGNGFAVAYIVADDLETIRSARTADWVGIFNRVRDLKPIDGNNVFLFSTREYANLSVYLTSKYNFSGFILEEPSYMLFSRNTHEKIIEDSDRLTPEEIWRRTDPTREFRYEQVLGKISTPIMLIRNPDSKAYTFNEKTLISKLNQVNAYYETVEVRGAGRALTVFGGSARSGVIEVSPEVSYYAPTVSKWVDEIITYMRINSSVDPIALRDPSNYRRW
ncbi:hypothetical protein VDG1235_154 [Verrucomicrobiia bacterium DG1235]|nr:hypothetical protein VDG1235_154 [Verrucomicrobiae bacterium DG1235]